MSHPKWPPLTRRTHVGDGGVTCFVRPSFIPSHCRRATKPASLRGACPAPASPVGRAMQASKVRSTWHSAFTCNVAHSSSLTRLHASSLSFTPISHVSTRSCTTLPTTSCKLLTYYYYLPIAASLQPSPPESTMLLHRALLTRTTATALCPSYSTISKARSIITAEPATRLAFRVSLQQGRTGISSGAFYATRKTTRVHAMATSAAAGSDLEAFGKAKSGSGSPSKERGDCPFSQRVYMELEEKKLPYTATYIEEGENKPDWFIEKNPKGLMPVLRDGEEWIQDSDKIAEYLEKKFPEVPLATPQEFKQIGLNIFQAFTSYLKSKNADDQSKEELVKELAALDEHLQTKGPYISGKSPTDSDYALIPKLHHLKVSLAHYMKFEIPAEFTALHKYVELMESRPSFQKTNSPDDMIIQGWQKKFGLPDHAVV